MPSKYLIWIILIFISCNERLNFTYKDSIQSDIAFFFENSDDFNVTHDIDRSIIQGSFKISNPEDFNTRVDSVANQKKWIKVMDNHLIKRFVKTENEGHSICVLKINGNIVEIKFFSHSEL